MLKAELVIPTPIILAVAMGLKIAIDVSVTMSYQERNLPYRNFFSYTLTPRLS